MDYYSDIIITIKEIGYVNIAFDSEKKDYVLNDKNPEEIPQDYLTKLYELFDTNLSIYLRHDFKIDDINEFIEITKETSAKLKLVGDNHRVNFLLSIKKGELSDSATQTHENINSIISTQKLVLNKVLVNLYSCQDKINTNTPEAFLIENNSDKETSSSDIPFKIVNRATFKMKKKESLMLVHLLEKCGLLEFEDYLHKCKFMEANFNYTETFENSRNFKDVLPMKGTGKEFTNFDAFSELKQSKKTFEKVILKLESVMNYEYDFKRNKN